jgi:Predicted acetyltransferase
MILESVSETLEQEIVAFWNGNMPKAYRVTKKMINQKLIRDPNLFADGSFICHENGKIQALIATKLSDNSLPEYQNTAWLSTLIVDSSFRRKGIGTFAYRKTEGLLRASGVKKIIIAGEMDNFFSGIPAPDTASTEFFREMGYILNVENHFDLMNDVSKLDFDSLRVPCYTNGDYITRPVEKGDFNALEGFFQEVFPGRWEQEVMGYLYNGGDPKYVLGLFKNGVVKGFCRVSLHTEPGEYNMFFGDNWGSLGPIGISADIRGCGLGNHILGDALRYLKKIGAHNVNIDWTVLRKYYGQFGFEPWRTYLAAYKELP